jgi:hypothetical protein
MEREESPEGACEGCGGALMWATVRYHPSRRSGNLIEPGRWEGLDATCASALGRPKHPCHAGDGADTAASPLATPAPQVDGDMSSAPLAGAPLVSA